MVHFSRFLLTITILLLTAGLLYARDGGRSYTLSGIQFEIDGITREGAIRNNLNLKDGSYSFDDESSMITFVEDLKQELLNLRVFEKVETELEQQEEENTYILTVRLKDSWTLFPLIVPTFDTNDDLALKWKINYANVAGSLMELNVEGDFGIARNLINDRLDINYWKVETTLSNFILGGVAYSGSWIQGYYRIIEKEGTDITDFYTFSKSDFVFAGTFDLGDHYFYELAPAVELTYNYQDKLEGGSSNMRKEPQSYGIYQRGGLDQVDWKGNFLTGENWELALKSRIVPGDGFKASMTATNRYFTILTPRTAFGNRFIAMTTINDELYALGEYMRGVADFNLSGDKGLFINNTYFISLFNWKGVMETQIQPFLDLGVVNPSGREMTPREDMRMSMGGDLVFFPEKITSINLRFTFGYDLFGPGSPSDRFEMLLSTSLFY